MSDPTVRMPRCQSCGTIASPGDSYCRQCGKSLLAATVAAAPPFPQTHPTPPPQSTVTAVSPANPAGMPLPQQRPLNVGRKRRSPLLLGCLVLLGLIFVGVAAGGIYIWRSASYTIPERQTPALPERAAGTINEFPVDNDPIAPATPNVVQTEALGGSVASWSTQGSTKLPPGIDRTRLAKGATSITLSTYKPRPKTGGSSSATPAGDVYISVLKAMPNQPDFGRGLANSIVDATGGQQTVVRVQSPTGAVYLGSKIRSSEVNAYVLTKQGGEVVILIYSDDPANQSVVDRLAQNVGNGHGLIDYPEVKDSLWTLPASTPPGLTFVDLNTVTGSQMDEVIAGATGGNDEDQKILSKMRAFLPERLTSARYLDQNKGEWMTLNFQYESSFRAWRTWLLARGVLGLGGAKSTTVRDVTGLYLDQEGVRLLVFQKGPYLIFLTGPSGASMDRLVNLGNLFQV